MVSFIFLKFGQTQFLTNFVVADAQRLNLRVCHMNFPDGFKTHTVDDVVRVDMLPVNVRANQNLAVPEILPKS